jgi:hypothetical protein
MSSAFRLCSDLDTNRIVVDRRDAPNAGTSGIVGRQKILSRTFFSRTAQILINCRDFVVSVKTQPGVGLGRVAALVANFTSPPTSQPVVKVSRPTPV